MKILESQSATLTNYEVYQHLKDQRDRPRPRGLMGKRPGNLETVVKEIFEYFRELPSPLGSKDCPYNEKTIKTLVERLRPYIFAKAELLMIMNLRPTNLINLNTVVEEVDARFSEEQQEEIVAIIVEVLGKSDWQAEKQAMERQASAAQKVDAKPIQQEQVMGVDS